MFANNARKLCDGYVLSNWLMHGLTLTQRVDQAPFKAFGVAPGETPTALAISWGKGDPHKDPIFLVYADEKGEIRTAFLAEPGAYCSETKAFGSDGHVAILTNR